VENIMKGPTVGLLAGIAVILPAAAFAQSSDRDYCRALVAKYEGYLDQSQRRGEAPQSLDAKLGVEKCKAGDVSGIPAIEKALENAKLSLPSRS
jgi:hypothetical protein